MNTSRIAVWPFAFALLAGGVCWLALLIGAGRELRAAEERAWADLQSNRRLATKWLVARRNAATTAPVAKAATAPAAGADAPAKTDPAVMDPRVNFGHRVNVALSHMPEYAPLRRAEVHRWVMREYGEWLGQLNVAPERLAAVKELMTDFRLAGQDAQDALVAEGYRSGTREFDAVYGRYLKENEELLRQKLSAGEFASYQEFAKGRDWTARGADVDAYLEERGLPALSAAQKAALTAAYVAAGANIPEGAPTTAAVYRARHDKMAELIGPALNPAQAEAVRAYLKYLNERSQVVGRVLHPKEPDMYIVVPATSSR